MNQPLINLSSLYSHFIIFPSDVMRVPLPFLLPLRNYPSYLL